MQTSCSDIDTAFHQLVKSLGLSHIYAYMTCDMHTPLLC